jgi:ABC-type sulfate transport system permease component
MIWTIIAWIVTVLLIPLIIAFWRSESKRNAQMIASKDALDIERHTALAALVSERHNAVMKKLTEYCTANGKDHDELFTERRQHEVRIKAIETVHEVRGCNLAMRG